MERYSTEKHLLKGSEILTVPIYLFKNLEISCSGRLRAEVLINNRTETVSVVLLNCTTYLIQNLDGYAEVRLQNLETHISQHVYLTEIS